MSLREQTVAEMRQRMQLLEPELAAWKAMTDENAGGLGIHQSQITAVNLMFEELFDSHEALLGELKAEEDPQELAQLRSDLEAALGGAHGLMAIFRHILAQRLDESRYRAELEAADLVAAACYRPCIRLAQDWAALPEGQFREPPLTFLNARPSPQALTRRHVFAALG